MKAVVLFTYEHGAYYLETIELRDIEEVEKRWTEIFKVIDCTGDNWRNYLEVRDELYSPTAQIDGNMLAVIESVYTDHTSDNNTTMSEKFLLNKKNEERNSVSKDVKDIFEYNTKNAGKQLLNLANDFYKCPDSVSKIDIIESMRSIGVELIKQYEEHKDKF